MLEHDGRTRPTPARKEHAGIDHPLVGWTSFDRYARYASIASAIRINLGDGPNLVVDAGDSSAWLAGFDPSLRLVTVDLTIDPHRIVDASPVVGDGSRLPVRDGAVPAVVSSDALEHVLPDARPAFLRELARASSDMVVLAAPFDTPGVAGVEEFVRRFVFATTGIEQPQLEEHAERGLPELDLAVGTLETAGMRCAVVGNGNLHDWLLAMVLKHLLTGRDVLDLRLLDLSFDVMYNTLLADRNNVPPYYRHVIVARHDEQPILPTTVRHVEGEQPDVSALLAALTAASAAEGTRRSLTEVGHVVERLEAQQDTAARHLMDRFSGVEAALAAVLSRLDQIDQKLDSVQADSEVLRHPLSAVSRRLRRPPEGDEGS